MALNLLDLVFKFTRSSSVTSRDRQVACDTIALGGRSEELTIIDGNHYWRWGVMKRHQAHGSCELTRTPGVTTRENVSVSVAGGN